MEEVSFEAFVKDRKKEIEKKSCQQREYACRLVTGSKEKVL